MGEAPAVAAAIFGDRLPLAVAYHDSLAYDGPIRGLNGPRELPVLWERHIVNSACLAKLPTDVLPPGATVCDVGSGAGLPGIPLALARPDLQLTLLDPLQRRVTYLEETVKRLALGNVRVIRGRAEDRSVQEQLGTFDVVTSRAVAPLTRLLPWCAPLIAWGGRLAALKGRAAEVEIDDLDRSVRTEFPDLRVLEVTIPGFEDRARVVVGTRTRRPPRSGRARRG